MPVLRRLKYAITSASPALALGVWIAAGAACGGPPRVAEMPGALADAGPTAPAPADAAPADSAPVDAAPSGTWQDVDLTACGVHARMLGPARESTQTIATDSGPAKMTILMYDAPGGGAAMGLTCSEKVQFKTSKAADDHQLDGSRDGMVKNVHGTLVSEKAFVFAGFPARELVIRTKTQEIAARIVLMRKKGRMLTQIAVNVDGQQARTFLDSLALTP